MNLSIDKAKEIARDLMSEDSYKQVRAIELFLIEQNKIRMLKIVGYSTK